MSEPVQNFSNHSRTPTGLIVATAILLVGIGLCIAGVAMSLMESALATTLVGVGAAVIGVGSAAGALVARFNSLTVQDRIIRLETRLRLEKLLPAELQARIGELSLDQLIALRFASDAELAALTREVLEQRITARADIKKKIKNWQADHLRV